MNSMLFAEHAYLPGGWRRNVLLRWDRAGKLVEVTPDTECPVEVERATGPVLPGMPNLHSHAFQRAMAGLTEYRATASDTFWSWRNLMYRFALEITPESIGAIARWLYIEMLKTGYTSVCEFHYVHHAQDGARYPRSAEMAVRVAEAAHAAGIGMTMLPVLYQYSDFGEQIPRDDQRRFINTPEALLELLDGLRQALPEQEWLRYGVAPHSLRAVSEPSLRALLDGMPADAPVHIHIAEQTAEVEGCLRVHGARPVQWLLERFDVNARWCLVHATHIDAVENRLLAKSGAVAGLCLTTEANLGDGIFPAADFLALGGVFGIGSDSHTAIDWRAELRLLEYGQRLVRRERNVLADGQQTRVADRLFDAAVAGGARASGRALAGLSVGCQADWIVLDPLHPAIAEHGADTWLSGVVFAEHGETPVFDVYASGRKVVSARRHYDEETAYAAYRAALAQLLN